MERLKDFLGRPGFHFLFFCFSLLLFGWPLLTISENENYGSIFVYLYFVWSFVILCLLLISGSCQKEKAEQ